jgi:hypothetical protein
MNLYSLEQLTRQHQNELIEEGLREAMVRQAHSSTEKRRFPLRLIRIVGAGLTTIVRQIAITLGF